MPVRQPLCDLGRIVVSDDEVLPALQPAEDVLRLFRRDAKEQVGKKVDGVVPLILSF